MSELDIYKEKLERAEHKIRILEDLIENKSRELYKKNEDLIKLNEEITNWTFAIGHDLQEPLRTLIGFSEILGTKCVKSADDSNSEALDECMVKYIEHIQKSAYQMQAMILGILEFTRIGKKVALSSVDTKQILEQVIHGLTAQIQANHATVTFDSLPNFIGYKSYIAQLFQNLISNGIKFAQADRAPKIKISAEELEDKIKFSVSDNGIGIDETNHQLIFNMFKRVNSRENYKGYGIGLAHCKRIVELHGGEIQVESSKGQGSTFHFTISKELGNKVSI